MLLEVSVLDDYFFCSFVAKIHSRKDLETNKCIIQDAFRGICESASSAMSFRFSNRNLSVINLKTSTILAVSEESLCTFADAITVFPTLRFAFFVSYMQL